MTLLFRPVRDCERRTSPTNEVYRILSVLETSAEQGWKGELDLSLVCVIKLRKFGFFTALMRHRDKHVFFRTDNFYVDPYPKNYIIKLEPNNVVIEHIDSLSDYFKEAVEIEKDTEGVVIDVYIDTRSSPTEEEWKPEPVSGYQVIRDMLEGDYKLPLLWKEAAEELENEFKHYRYERSSP